MVVCVRTGLVEYTCSTVNGGLCQEWFVSLWLLYCVRTGLLAYGNSIVSGLVC